MTKLSCPLGKHVALALPINLYPVLQEYVTDMFTPILDDDGEIVPLAGAVMFEQITAHGQQNNLP